MATYRSGRGVIIEDPDYDPGCNILTAVKVAVDGIDDDGGVIFVDLEEVDVLEPITLIKMQQARENTICRSDIQRIQSRIELATVVSNGRKLGVISGGAEPAPPEQNKGTVGPIRAVPPPERR